MGTAVVLLVLIVIVVLAIRSTFGLGKKKHSDGSGGGCGGGCGSGCSSCPYCDSCKK